MTEKYLVVDVSGMMHRNYHVYKNEEADIIVGMTIHTSMMTLKKYNRLHKPTAIVLCFDRSSWRKEYTMSQQCVSQRVYKGDRRVNATEAERVKFEQFLENCNSFENIMREHSSMICLSAPKLEADDLIAGFVQMHSDDDITIISRDKDFVQLLTSPNIRLVDPATDKPIYPPDDLKYHMLLKCIRGGEDHIQSAYPGLRESRLKKAYTDTYEMANIMAHTWTRAASSVVPEMEFKVGDLYEENRLLMDLTQQPPNIRKLIDETIRSALANRGEFSYLHFLKMCGQYELKQIVEQIDYFIPMLTL